MVDLVSENPAVAVETGTAAPELNHKRRRKKQSHYWAKSGGPVSDGARKGLRLVECTCGHRGVASVSVEFPTCAVCGSTRRPREVTP
jgi:hypothetical protein